MKTLNETLAELGYQTVISDFHQKKIICDGHVVFEGTARATWKWLRETGQIKQEASTPSQ